MRRFVDKLTFAAFPKALLEMIRTYFRIEVEGIEHLPRRGKTLIAPNHSGCAGLDAAMLGHILNRELHRVPKILTLWTLFNFVPTLGKAATKLGLQQASSKNGIELLKKNHLTVVFPEGEKGSFKPSCDRYRLQQFHTGFVRMALLSNAPLVPCIIIGAEEANINLGAIRFEKLLKGLTIPVPFNLIPFPAKWKIQFLPPSDLSRYTLEDVNNRTKMQEAADQIRETMQRVIDLELLKRNYVYFGNQPLLNFQSLLLERKTG